MFCNRRGIYAEICQHYFLFSRGEQPVCPVDLALFQPECPRRIQPLPPADSASTQPGCPNDQYWLKAKETVYRSVMDILAQDQTELDKGTRYHKLIHGDREKKYIALTFDDGPHPKFTPRLLAFLKQYKVKATFFVVGEMAEKYPQLVKAEADEGHCVGNHTYHHVNLTKIDPGYVATEIEACNEVVKRITGHTPRYFRPPGGDYNHQTAEICEAMNQMMVLWSDDPGDFRKPGESVIELRLLNKVKGGAIILLHDGIEQTLAVLPQVIATLRKQGYEFVTIDQLVAYEHLDKPSAMDKLARENTPGASQQLATRRASANALAVK